ncbi:MAG TPA: NAD-dependent epimerase/dehydratase family protein, partial [Spirochaetes bacterium]|nr:NAD-dependent epimerase/dehydratase family protein [Spirochaetota bacterium]
MKLKSLSTKLKKTGRSKKPAWKGTALVTGAGGFIGSRLVEALVEKNYRVRALFLPGENAAGAEKLGADIIRGDITNPGSLKGIAWNADLVFHLATRVLDWGGRKLFRRLMVDGTRNLLEECRRCGSGRFIYFSSIAALGLGRPAAGLDEDAERVATGIPYGDTKIEAEDLVSAYCRAEDIPFTIIRPANVTGPGSVWVKDILDAFFRGPLPLIDGGRAPGAFVYVDNLVDGAILAARSPVAAGRTYHFRDDYDITWGQYIALLGGLIGRRPRGNIPFRLAWTMGHLLETLLSPLGVRPPMTRLAAGVMGRNNDVDASRARRELGWKSRVDLETALGAIERWVRD